MVNTAPLLAMWHEFVSVLGMGAGIILGYAAGRPVKRITSFGHWPPKRTKRRP